MSNLVRPHKVPAPLWREILGLWWRRRVLPPGPCSLFHMVFITIVGKPTALLYALWENIGSLGWGENRALSGFFLNAPLKCSAFKRSSNVSST